jgi:hypothetical protein
MGRRKALLVIAVAMALTSCANSRRATSLRTSTPNASPTRSHRVADRVVPWSDRTDFTPWNPPPPEPRPAATPCTHSDLRLERATRDGASQRTFLFVSLTKLGPGRCTLTGYPRLKGTDESGTSVVISPQHDEAPPASGETPATIGRHETAQMTITTGLSCLAGQGEAPLPYQSWTGVALVLADKSQVALDRDLTTVCTPKVSRFYRDTGSVDPPSRWPGLRVEMLLPGSVSPGHRVDYNIVLRNTTDRELDLMPCGGYRQQVWVVGPGLAAAPIKGGLTEYRLNCDDSPALPPGGKRRYAMQLTIPATATGSEVLFSWNLLDNTPDEGAQDWVTLD